jgi:hypothetical protein
MKKSLKIPKGYSESVYQEEQTKQWPKEKVQKDKQRSTKHTRQHNGQKKNYEKTINDLQINHIKLKIE